MEEYQKKRRVKKVIYSIPTAIFLAVIVILIGKGSWTLFWQERDTNKQLAVVKGELEKLIEKEKILENSVNELQTDRGIEAEVRSRFSVVREDEQLFVVVDSASVTQTATEVSFWEKFKDFFGFTKD